jgi:hypothetical protein
LTHIESKYRHWRIFAVTERICSTEKSHNHVATLIISLPSKHKGDNVELWHADKHLTLQTEPLSDTDFQYLCWFTDVTHEIKPVTTGIRLVLIYNVCVHKSNVQRLQYNEPGDPQVRKVREALER